MTRLRGEFPWLSSEATTVLKIGDDGAMWWTFAGLGTNASLAPALSHFTASRVVAEDVCVTFGPNVSVATIESAISQVRLRDPGSLLPDVDEQALKGLKFSDCIPSSLAHQLLRIRLHDHTGVHHVLHSPTRIVKQANG
jgi:ATP-dependent Lhr-like helicase